MILINNKYINLLSQLSIFIFGVSILILNLSGIGGYNINDNLSIADRFINTGYYFYTSGDKDNFSGTPAYFPGFSFIIIFVQQFVKHHLVEIISIISGAFILSLLYLTNKISIQLGANKDLSKLLIPLLATLFYPSWIWYAIDFKPDTFLLALFLFSLLIINSKLSNSVKVLAILMITFIGTITKQQFLSLFISILYTLYLYEEKTFSKKSFFAILGSLFGLFVIFSIDNLYLITIQIQKQREFQSLPQIANLINTELKSIWPIIILTYIYISNYWQNSKLENSLIFASLSWLIFSLFSAFHVGGTIENFTTGLLLFLPFTMCSASKIFFNLKLKNQNSVQLLLVLFLFITSLANTAGSLIESKIVRETKNEIIIYLNKNFKNSKAVYDGVTYSIIRESSVIGVTEIDAVMNFESAKINTDVFYQKLKNGFYEVIVTNDDEWKTNQKLSLIIKDYFVLEKSYEIRKFRTYIFKRKSNKI